MEVALEAGHLFEAAFDVAGLGLDLLHANTIRRQFAATLGHALGGGRTHAVEVEAGQFEQGIPDGCEAGQDDRLALDFVQFAVEAGVLRFGEFKTKAGRLCPYFFNAGLFDDGAKLRPAGGILCRAPDRLGPRVRHAVRPRLQGHPLAAVVAIELARRGRNVPYAYNRKEAKDHGEGGTPGRRQGPAAAC
jgi:hypothetical protein